MFRLLTHAQTARRQEPGRLRPAVPVIVATAAVLALGVPGTALAFGDHGHRGHQAVPPPPAHPTSADQIQNIGQVATAIKAYYGDTVTDRVDPVTDDGEDVTLHTFSPDSAYAHEMARIERRAQRYLAHPRGHHRGQHARHADHHADHRADHRGHRHGKPAILLDVDDTTLNTYSYEIYANFGYDPHQNAEFVTSPDYDLPAVPGMPRLVDWAADHGYAVFFLTGRPEDQRAGTEQDLTRRDYPILAVQDPTNPDNLYLNNAEDDQAQPWITCDDEGDRHCTTIERKSQTRRHIERDLGYDIVANFGDQFSDLEGGYADRTFKLPNPMYYLP